VTNSLVGTWKLLSREDVTANGERRAEPMLGSDPVAFLMYDAAGHFSAQFMRRNRTLAEVDVLSLVSANNSNAVNGYDAYFGRYSVENGTVTQELLGALSPSDVGKVVTRRFEISEDALVIQLHATSDGEPVIRTLRWERVG